jgi:hypothetical protein
MRNRVALLLANLTVIVGVCLAQNPAGSGKSARVALFKMPYVGERNVTELSGGPDYLTAKKDKTGVSRQAAYNLILGAVAGVQQRKTQ